MIEQGLYELTAAEYHADPCEAPSLNNSLIGHLLNCPAQAFERHPRLNPGHVREESSRLDMGTVVHALLLGKGRDLAPIEADSYRTKAAQEMRDAARARGQTPILAADRQTAEEVRYAAMTQLAQFDNPEVAEYFDLSRHKSEAGLFWFDEAGCWGRSLIDRLLCEDHGWTVIDYKTVGRSANPDALGTHVIDRGYDTQMAMIERGLFRSYPQLSGRLKFRWVFQGVEPPYLLSVVEPDSSTMTIARKKVDYAFHLFAKCLRENHWPGYPARVVPLRHNEYLANRWLEREIAESDGASFVDTGPTLKTAPSVTFEKRKPRGPKKSDPLPPDFMMGG